MENQAIKSSFSSHQQQLDYSTAYSVFPLVLSLLIPLHLNKLSSLLRPHHFRSLCSMSFFLHNFTLALQRKQSPQLISSLPYLKRSHISPLTWVKEGFPFTPSLILNPLAMYACMYVPLSFYLSLMAVILGAIYMLKFFPSWKPLSTKWPFLVPLSFPFTSKFLDKIVYGLSFLLKFIPLLNLQHSGFYHPSLNDRSQHGY